MRIGLIARGEHRGLGHMTREFYRHVEPDRTLLVDLGPLARGYDVHDDWYPDATRMSFDGVRFSDETAVKRWLRGLDVLYSAETFYDWRLVNWCADVGVRTVCHVMPEFYKHVFEPLPYPSAWWAPTSWRLDRLPPSTRVVPVPVALDRFRRASPPSDGPLTLLHVVGKPAAHDRAGTNVLTQALRKIADVQLRVIVRTQDAQPRSVALPRGVEWLVERIPGEYWELYDGASLMVQPRRYGGLSLPLNEGSAAGLGLVLPDTEPHREWAGVYIAARPFGTLVSGAGEIPMFECDSRLLAGELTLLASDASRVEDLRASAYCWALEHSWKKLAGLYLTELERVCQ